MNKSRSSKPLRTTAWAAVNKRTGKVLRDLDGQYAIFNNRAGAKKQCPSYGVVRGVSVRVLPTAEQVRGILK